MVKAKKVAKKAKHKRTAKKRSTSLDSKFGKTLAMSGGKRKK